MSIARKFKAKVLEENPPEKPVTPEKQVTTGLSDKLISLKEGLAIDVATLKQLSGDEERTPYKKELIEKYRPLINHIMTTHQNWARQPPMFWWLMWRIDVEPFIDIAEDLKAGVEHGLTTPQEFKRDWQTIYLDQVFEHFNQALKENDLNNLHLLQSAITDINQGRIVTNVPLKAKILALSGKFAHKTNDLLTAKKHYQQALILDEKSGVKRLLAEVKETLKTQEEIKNDTTN